MSPSALHLTVRPWPRTLVTLPARLWWAGPDRLEAWSAPALPCHPDVTAGQTYTDPAQFPTCAGGRAQAGTTAYHRIGVAWQRWTLAAGPLFGFRPPGAFERFVQDRDPQDPIHRLREVYLPVDPGSDRLLLSYAWSTASFPTTPDLLPRGPRWNPECQTRDCPAPERVIAWDMPAYRLRVRSWWRAQWAHRYLLLRAVEWQTICRPVPDAD
ncbi:MAG: hypothetical protein C4313_09845, partial [Thermoflexus sp.]|uniref:hypothetical protein n=1 Tax=Thermoflexus sp. TaxID=1969742 RepID=UPI00331726CF